MQVVGTVPAEPGLAGQVVTGRTLRAKRLMSIPPRVADRSGQRFTTSHDWPWRKMAVVTRGKSALSELLHRAGLEVVGHGRVSDARPAGGARRAGCAGGAE